MEKLVSKELENRKVQCFSIDAKMNIALIFNKFEHTIKSGNWNIKRFHINRKGVTDQLNRMSYISAIANMTKIQSQMEKTMKITGPRVLQSSHWGMLCASDTPEGEKCGLTKNLALLTHITIN